ncbi:MULTISPECIES: ABC transporter ATP-binding protein [unclassified Bacillus cereus group]|uniref:ABC transporter ATP-binding protein n=1 Tax=unclassified Bacillus cereus group TaxID=2750818 RepID=UPI001F5AE7FE|nr:MULTISPECIES: ABC transporter ATP-binding protein [unclassified Bacillus cereus group]
MEIIRLDHVSKVYRLGKTEVPALQNIDLAVKKSEFLGIIGPSGSGKSTILNIIGCMDSITSGQLWINDKDVSRISDSEATNLRSEMIGFIFQSFNLIPVLTVYENIELPLLLQKHSKTERHEKITRIIEQVGLQHYMHHKPDELSGGQRQRVAIARAIVGEPKLVIADEPTASLDSETGKAIMNMMLSINESNGTTFIFTTHDPSVMKYAKRIITIKDGKIEKEQEYGQNN